MSPALPKKEAVVAIPETLVGRAKSGAASVTLWSEPGKKYTAKLREDRADGRSATRTYLAKFSLPEADDKVSLGMTATLTLSDAATERVARLPLSALFSEGGKPSSMSSTTTARVTLKPVAVKSYESNDVVIASGVGRGRQDRCPRRAEARSEPARCGSCRHYPSKSLRVRRAEVVSARAQMPKAEAAKRSRTCPAPGLLRCLATTV